MPWPVHPNGLLGAQGDQDTYRIERSLRFNSADSAYLSRTPASAGNRRVFTLSGWVKRSLLNAWSPIMASGVNLDAGQTDLFGFDISNGISILANFGDGTYAVSSSSVFRDFSAWYHIIYAVDTTQATNTNRVKVYVNGVEQALTGTYPIQNFDCAFNTTNLHAIGARSRTGSASNYFNGYLTEINFIDGQALTPSSFGETDAITGRWKAKAYGGTYGTNGFYLKFADNSGTTATTLGKDSSPNGNNWTPNNFSVTAGVGNDSLVDSPTNYGTDSGVGGEARGNYATFNSLSGSTLSTYSNGNLQVSGSGASAGSFGSAYSSFGMTTGKWYAEFTWISSGANGNSSILGVGSHIYQRNDGNQNAVINGITSINLDSPTATNRGVYENGILLTGSDASFSFSVNDVIGITFDADAKIVNFYKNGSILGSTYPYDVASVGGGVFYFIAITRVNNGASSFAANFGQHPFAYTAPSGFKALCTTNLPTPSIQKSSKYMDVVAYTGTGASNSISSLGFSPDLVWIKNRGGATSHAIYDTTRGTQNQLSSDTTGDAVTSSTGLTAFNTSGFTVGTSTLVNTSGTQYVAWAWDESPTSGLDVVAYTGNGANRTISHNLGVAPKMIIVKARTTAGADQGWPVYHASNTAAPETDYLLLDGIAATADLDTVWNDTAPTSSVFSVGTSALVNTNNDTYIAYCFSEIEGYSKFGSYTGNGSADGPFVFTGMRPRWIMIKKTATGVGDANWVVFDTARDSFNQMQYKLYPSSSSVENGITGETTTTNAIDILCNGFKARAANAATNESGVAYIFAAFAEAPFKYARAR